MKERPILFSTEMVRAILDGRKTMTRRVMKPQPELRGNFYEFGKAGWSSGITSITPVYGHSLYYACPYGIPGDRLWVKETWAYTDYKDVCWKATDGESRIIRWRSPIFMPRWASRINLEITGVRVERLQEMTYHDLEAEGMQGELGAASEEYIKLWDTLNAKRGYPWSSTPWVWVIEFRRVSDGR